jgi:hypothetical protein
MQDHPTKPPSIPFRERLTCSVLEAEETISSWPTSPIPDTKWSIKTQFILCVHLVPAEKQEGDIQILPGKSVDDLIEEAKRLDFEVARHPATVAWRYGRRDDDFLMARGT